MLAVCEHPDELLADFQQCYHIDLWGTRWDLLGDDDAAHVAALAYQLPRDSRVWSAIEPAKAHGQAVRLLRDIEHNQRVWHWAHTKEAKDKETAPEPQLLPGEQEAYERAVASAEDDAARTAELLGITL